MKLIVITTDFFFEGEAGILNLLFERGLETLHLRKPFSEKEEVAQLLSRIDPRYYGRIVLHDHFGLLSVFPLKGIHLNRRNPERIKGIICETVSRSCHSPAEVTESGDCDYVFLSSVFDSISKKGYIQSFSDAELREAKEQGIINHRVIALGGISEERIPVVAGYGFGGVAVLGVLWQEYEIQKDTEALLQRFKRLKIRCEQI